MHQIHSPRLTQAFSELPAVSLREAKRFVHTPLQGPPPPKHRPPWGSLKDEKLDTVWRSGWDGWLVVLGGTEQFSMMSFQFDSWRCLLPLALETAMAPVGFQHLPIHVCQCPSIYIFFHIDRGAPRMVGLGFPSNPSRAPSTVPAWEILEQSLPAGQALKFSRGLFAEP